MVKVKNLILILICNLITANKVNAFDTSNQALYQSCKEFKELMTAGNKLVFLRSDLARNNSTWKALICLECNSNKESSLIKVTNIDDGAVEWHYHEKDFLPIDEVIGTDEIPAKEILSMHGILSLVRTTCKAYLDPINEGSHLELSGREQCVRHEYLRLYLKRKYGLNESSYLELETKKDLTPNDFFKSCQNSLLQANERNIFSRTVASAYIGLKKILGIGLGEYEPIVSRDSKTFYREIANEQNGKNSNKPLK